MTFLFSLLRKRELGQTSSLSLLSVVEQIPPLPVFLGTGIPRVQGAQTLCAVCWPTALQSQAGLSPTCGPILCSVQPRNSLATLIPKRKGGHGPLGLLFCSVQEKKKTKSSDSFI